LNLSPLAALPPQPISAPAAVSSTHTQPSTSVPQTAFSLGAPVPALGGAQLVIEEQPKFRSFKKNTRVSPPFKVRAHLPPGVQATGPVKACLISDSPAPINLINPTAELAPDSTATFYNLKFEDGSRQNFVQLYFEARIFFFFLRWMVCVCVYV
jgi:hypothetical protein